MLTPSVSFLTPLRPLPQSVSACTRPLRFTPAGVLRPPPSIGDADYQVSVWFQVGDCHFYTT